MSALRDRIDHEERFDRRWDLLEKARRSPRDEATNQMKEPQVVLGLLGPAHEDAAEAVHPTVRAFHDPASGLEARLLLEGLRLFSPRTDMRGEVELLEQVPNFVVVVAFVQTQTLGIRGSGPGAANRNALDC